METTWTYDDLNKAYEQRTTAIRCECEISTDIVAGQPADEEGIRNFVKFHLKLTGQEADDAVIRIMRDEVGVQDTTPETGEIHEKESYGVNCYRRDEKGRPWIGNWMIKANLKQAASRIGIFMSKIGTKGDMSEGGRVWAVGPSLIDPSHPERIYVVDSKGGIAKTYFRQFMGRVHSPNGDVSIMHHSECITEGYKFYFEFRYLGKRPSNQELQDMLAMSMQCGLGSVRSLEMGKFKYLKAVLRDPARDREAKVNSVKLQKEKEKAKEASA